LITRQAAAPHIPSGGRVLFFSSSLTALSAIAPGYLLYAATKGAVEQMSRVLAKDFGRKGITVNTISPGPIATAAFYEGKTEEMVTMMGNLNPMGRIGTPEEIARVVAWVSGDESSWVNGQNLRVNGGMTVG
jgi:3-oxoacyl-[acyl-carrier protein] reductase